MTLREQIIDVLGNSGPKPCPNLVRILEDFDPKNRPNLVRLKVLQMLNAGEIALTPDQHLILPAKNCSLTEQLKNELPQMGDEFELSLDSTPQRNKLINTIRQMGEYETKILQAYADSLLKTRKSRVK